MYSVNRRRGKDRSREKWREVAKTEKADKIFYSALKDLLDQKLTPEEKQSLYDEGFKIKSPTRKAAVMVALYKKAAAGDLSAIKELINIVSSGEEPKEESVQAVMFIDDIWDPSIKSRGRRLQRILELQKKVSSIKRRKSL